MSTLRIAIIGAGPIGLEAALYGATLGHEVQVYERGLVGDSVLRWGHVTLFSPWALNHSSLGARTLRQAGASLPPLDGVLTGRQYVETYLRPLARSPRLVGRVLEGVEVLYVGRDRIGKRDSAGGARQRYPFRLLLQRSRGEELDEADVVIDCSGTYGNYNFMGNGNLPALGELGLERRIAYVLVDILGEARSLYEGKRVLLVGDGHSAATALEALTQLPGTSVVWISRKDLSAPVPVIADDPLPARARLARIANELAASGDRRIDFRKGTVIERVQERRNSFEIKVRSDGGFDRLVVDRILAHVGYHPHSRIYRELQVHECYASMAPMRLAAEVLNDGAAGRLSQSRSAETLRNPEPNFYILGAKSYGKHPNFLIRLGLEQVRDVYALIQGRLDLNLYEQ
jgi:thioredoxin reductase